MKNIILLFAALMCAICADNAFASDEVLRFDFGADLCKDTIQITENDKYTADKGYGFDYISFVKNVDASGEGVCADGIEFLNKNGHSSNFMVDLSEGIYELKIIAGDIETMNVTAEGYYAIMNMTYSGCVAAVEIPVTDGRLELFVSSDKKGIQNTISAVEIKRVSDIDDRRTHVFIGGDSLSASYYPLDIPQPFETGYQGGWGQMLSLCIPENLYVMNYSTGGQTADRFLKSGQFDAVEHYMQEGDYFIISFGVNDSTESDEQSFYNALSEMVIRTKNKGGIPVIVTSPGMLSDFDENGVCYIPGRWFKDTAIKVCREQSCNYVDMHNIASAYFTEIGEEETKKLYWTNWSGEQDFLHTSREGAGQLARLLCEELIRQEIWCFDGVIPDYGVSNDVKLKCSGVLGENKIIFQNTKPVVQEVRILVNKYNADGVLTGTEVQNVSLPAYDPLLPSQTITVVPDNAGENCRVYLISEEGLTSLDDTPEKRMFSTVYDNAARLF